MRLLLAILLLQGTVTTQMFVTTTVQPTTHINGKTVTTTFGSEPYRTTWTRERLADGVTREYFTVIF